MFMSSTVTTSNKYFAFFILNIEFEYILFCVFCQATISKTNLKLHANKKYKICNLKKNTVGYFVVALNSVYLLPVAGIFCIYQKSYKKLSFYISDA